MRRLFTSASLAGLLTFVTFQAAAVATPTYEITLQPIFVSGSTADSTRLATDLQYAAAIFGQLSVAVMSLPVIYSSAPANMVDFTKYSYNSGGRADIIPIFFVSTIYSSGAYRGLSLGSQVWVADSQAWDTMAHELAHVLTGFYSAWQPDPNDSAHSLDSTNLLAGGGIRQTPSSLSSVGTVDKLTASQLLQMEQTGHLGLFVQAQDTVPEPATMGLMGGALLALSFGIRKSRKSVLKQS